MTIPQIPACFRGRTAEEPGGSQPAVTTSVYETHLGLIALTWSRTALGLNLRADLRFSSQPGTSSSSSDSDGGVIQFRIRPWLLWRRKGSRRFVIESEHQNHRWVEFSWDLSGARFHSGGGPEPDSGFFVAVVVDGDMALVAGDLRDEAFKRTKAQRPQVSPFAPKYPVLISRREHAILNSGTYATTALLGGKLREIGIGLSSEKGGSNRSDVGMWVAVDGARILHVRRIRWKFRGSELIDLETGGQIQISWDLHNWLFQRRACEPTGSTASPHVSEDPGRAVFVLRFEGDGGHNAAAAAEESHFGQKRRGIGVYKGIARGYFGKTRNWSESSSCGDGKGRRRPATKSGRNNLLKARSSSSVSSTSSINSGSTVMDWTSTEESELQRCNNAFALVINLWKN